MTHAFILMCFCLLVGVFGDEVKSVSVFDGGSVTLNTDITDIKRVDLIEWRFETIRIARIKKSDDINPKYDDNNETQRFGGKLKLNSQTGDLIITNITSEHTGLYQLRVVILSVETIKRFNLTSYAPLSVPVITSVMSQCSRLHCALLCSVMNVRDVSLSWYKGNSLLSLISVSDFNIRLSLPLEVEYQDNNTYSCVVNNHISNQTKHFCLADLCQPCSDVVRASDSAEAVLILLMVQLTVSALMVVGAVVVLGYDIKSRRDEQKRKSQTSPATSDE
ncbi:uncharacterized protein [Misgurnus anguillicaudatus]|uniref:uncharacterized protein n=1 Tax=Misgurnus anguillicaudatus TaxID=75329 RepID=UPI003CCF125C